MSKVLVTEQYLSDIGSAIRAKAGVSEAFQPAQMASAINEIPSGGGTEAEDGLVTRTLTSYENSRVRNIGSYAFYSCDNLTTVSFPKARYIKNYAFYYCDSLTTISFPVATNIESYAFYSCTSLTTINFPKATYIESYVFRYCYSLTTASFPVATIIGSWAFNNCRNLLSLYLLGSSVPVLMSTNVFGSTPISNYTTSTGGVYGSIYVPASLYSSYKTATNWTTYSSRFVSV